MGFGELFWRLRTVSAQCPGGRPDQHYSTQHGNPCLAQRHSRLANRSLKAALQEPPCPLLEERSEHESGEDDPDQCGQNTEPDHVADDPSGRLVIVAWLVIKNTVYRPGGADCSSGELIGSERMTHHGAPFFRWEHTHLSAIGTCGPSADDAASISRFGPNKFSLGYGPGGRSGLRDAKMECRRSQGSTPASRSCLLGRPQLPPRA